MMDTVGAPPRTPMSLGPADCLCLSLTSVGELITPVTFLTALPSGNGRASLGHKGTVPLTGAGTNYEV